MVSFYFKNYSFTFFKHSEGMCKRANYLFSLTRHSVHWTIWRGHSSSRCLISSYFVYLIEPELGKLSELREKRTDLGYRPSGMEGISFVEL